MTEQAYLTPGEIIGDGFGDDVLVQHVAEAVPFMQFAIADMQVPADGRKPNEDPSSWFLRHNCAAATLALAVYLDRLGYIAHPIKNETKVHVFLEVGVGNQKVYIDPTPMQFLEKYGIDSHNTTLGTPDNISSTFFPNERVLIFKPEDYQNVAWWMAQVVKRFWQTKALGLYAAGFSNLFPPYGEHRARSETLAEISAGLAKLYDPSYLVEFDEEGYSTYNMEDFAIKYENWLAGKWPKKLYYG